MASIGREDVIEILKIVHESEIDELHLETGDLKLVLKKYGQKENSQSLESSPQTKVTSEDPPFPKTGEDVGKSLGPESEMQRSELVHLEEDGFLTIKAPMLGTFYRAPKPDAPPFVEVGQLVTEQDVVCIIEVMKLFNMVRAGVKGRIARICAENAQMVEYNQVLFQVEKVEES